MSSGDLDEAVALGHPDIVQVRIEPHGEVRGLDALRDWMEPDAFESQLIEPLDFDVVGDRLLVRVNSKARGAGSGIEVEIVAWTLYTFDGQGLITRAQVFPEHEEEEARIALRGG